MPARSFAGIPSLLDWTNVAPRFGAAYDLTGDSKTALKFAVSKYYASVTNQYSSYRPLSAQTDVRNWSDCAYLPGTSTCNPALIGAPGYRDDIAQDNEIGPSTNSQFGLAAERRKDPDLKRPYNLEYTIGVDHQLTANLSVSAALVQARCLRSRENRQPVDFAGGLRAVHGRESPDRRGHDDLQPESEQVGAERYSRYDVD